MIAFLRGRVLSVQASSAVLDVGGVGYLFSASSATLRHLQPGQEAQVYTEMIVRQDMIALFGFIDEEEKQVFTILTDVPGVGPKVALGILSALTPEALSLAVMSGDKAALSQAPGVGPKLAARLVTELKDKLSSARFSSSVLSSLRQAKGKEAGKKAKEASIAEDAVSALVNLGYGRAEAFQAVLGYVSSHENENLQVVIRESLKLLSK